MKKPSKKEQKQVAAYCIWLSSVSGEKRKEEILKMLKIEKKLKFPKSK